MRSGAGSMSTLSIIRAAILARRGGPFVGSSIFKKLCAGVSSLVKAASTL